MAGLKRAHDGKIAGLYDLDKTLGRGHFAVVKLAKHVFTGEKVAVKVIDKTKLDPVARGHLFQEVRCMKMVQHPNVVRLYEAIDTATKLYLVLELADGGDLYDCIMKHEGGLSEEVAKCYFAQIVHAISYCHRLHVVHRDLKPENVVFFQQRGLVKLTDFGFSNRFQPGKKLNTSCGSLAYSAPEILLGDEYDAPAVDIWSLGVILFMLVCGQPPFHETNDSETLTMIMDCKYTVPAHISHACKDLIGRMLQREPKQRASLEQIEGHDWLQGVDPSPSTKLSTPLVSHRSLSEEEHGCIMQRMVLGGISNRDTITEALESDKYNHITATYFLLAERILREKQEKEQHSQSRSASPSKAQFRQSWPSRMDIHQDVGDGLGGPSISHPGCPQSPARSAESLHRGPCTALPDLSQLQGSGYTQRRGQQERPKAPAKPRSLGPGPGLSCVEEDEVGEGEEEEEQEAEGGGVSSLQVLLHCKGTSSASSSSPSSSSSAANRLAARVSAPVLHKGEEQGEEVEKERAPSEQGRGGAGGAGQASPGSGQSRGVSRTTSGLVESLKLMSLCLSSQLHSLAVGGAGAGAGEPHDRPVWRMCMGGSTGSLDRVSLLGGPTPRAHLHHQPAPGDLLADPLLEGSRSGPLRLDELDLARENQRNLKNQVLQMPLSDKMMSVNTRHSPKEALLYTPAPHNCCQVI